MEKPEKIYICKYCYKGFNRSTDIANHIRLNHLPKKVYNKIKCKYCYKEIVDVYIRKHELSCKKRHKEYYCEKCGKLVTKRFGSGKFCSRKCANSHIVTQETKNKISKKLKIFSKSLNALKYEIKRRNDLENRKIQYYSNPAHCKICNKILDYNKRHRKTCGNRNYLHEINKNNGGYKKHSRNGSAGYYKGIYCDSTYELMFLIWCLDHNVKIKRNILGFKYIFNGKEHTYYPDFLINDKMLIELKNYETELVKVKLKSVNRPIKILYGKDLEIVAKYVSKKYNKKYKLVDNKLLNNFKELYDK